MTNREVINKLKDFGFEDRTEIKYWTYPVYGGTMKQELQKDTLDFVKEYGDHTITIGVENDIWSFNGLTDEDNVIEGANVWTNHDCDNENYYKSSVIADIEEGSDCLIFTIRKRKLGEYAVYKDRVKIGFDKVEDAWEDDNLL